MFFLFFIFSFSHLCAFLFIFFSPAILTPEPARHRSFFGFNERFYSSSSLCALSKKKLRKKLKEKILIKKAERRVQKKFWNKKKVVPEKIGEMATMTTSSLAAAATAKAGGRVDGWDRGFFTLLFILF